MARAAAIEHGADWVLLSDGDEVWWPRGGSLKEVLAEVPGRYGVVRAISRYFVPRPDDERSFAERMTVRLTPCAPINDPATPFRPVAKLAHRAHPGVIVGNGNHSVEGIPFPMLEAWTPIELLHFPLRSAAQCAQKYRKTWLAWQVNLRGDIARARAMLEEDEGKAGDFFERVVVDDEAVERGLAQGTLVHDTRFRDALRTLAGTEVLEPDRSQRFPLPAGHVRSRLLEPDARGRHGVRRRGRRPSRGERRPRVQAPRCSRAQARARRTRMKVVMTMLVRDEEDILDAQLAFHLNAGVDLVIATDHRSQDGTTEILERYARDGYVHVLREESAGYRQSEWVTRMARLAATDFGADWVINSDADEFWWPREGPLKEILASVPRRYGIVRCYQRHFAPRHDEEGHFAERMTVRVTPHMHLQPEDPFQGTIQIVHRADPAVVVALGNHDVSSQGLVPLRGWYPLEVLHFPLRTLEQSRRKFEQKVRAIRIEPAEIGLHVQSAGRAIDDERFEEWYSRYVVDEAGMTRGLGDGSLVPDVRLRDALRRLAGSPSLSTSSAPTYALPDSNGSLLQFGRGGLTDAAHYADEMEPLDEWDSERRYLRRVEELEARVRELERGVGARVGQRIRRSVGSGGRR